ncbi:MAG: DUF3086 domain-containing protein [Xenococcaceae cyanobacterium]
MNSEDSQINPSNTQNSEEQASKSNSELENSTESTTDFNLSSDAELSESPNSFADEATESFVDNWLDELDIERTSGSIEAKSESNAELELSPDENIDKSEDNTLKTRSAIEELQTQIKELQQQKETLTTEIRNLQAQKQQLFEQQLQTMQAKLSQMVEEGTEQLQERKNTLQREIDKLERRQERIRQEMRTNFAGASQELAIRVQGFKDYLVGSLQDLAAAAEQLQLPNLEARTPPPVRQRQEEPNTEISSPQPQFTEQGFVAQGKKLRQLIDQYRSRPDYYGPPWQLRRTFEPIHAERVQDWFFTQGGRGTVKSMGSRLQNILVASAIASILHRLYGDRFRLLILVDTPERLGEWRRGLQDCLGISRADFGANRGVVLFESPEILSQRAERLLKEKLLPLVIIDETEESIDLSLLRFPLWLAFASELQPSTSGYLY